MSHPLNRRTFLKAGALLGLAPFVPHDVLGFESRAASAAPALSGKADIAVVTGTDAFQSTVRALDLLGGMQRFVSKNATVGLLINSRYDKPGTYVNPEIALAVLKMCLDAGASKFYSIEGVSQKYWNRTGLSEKFGREIGSIQSTRDQYTTVEVPRGVSLKKAEILRAYLDCDVLINMPIVKEHEGIRMTGSLKNIMGATSWPTNRYFHDGSGKRGYEDVSFLSQCIADANLLRKPTLCVMDATEFIITNGPFGPGKIARAGKIIAGADPVAVDSVGAGVLGLNPKDIMKISLAHKHGLGNIDLAGMAIKEDAL